MRSFLTARYRNTLISAGLLIAITSCLFGCGGKPLKPWHTEKLSEEFSTDKLDEVKDFNDYLLLEDRLFQQLDEQIYSVAETGPEFVIDRYSPGSAADPGTVEPNWNRSFELTSPDPKGAVLLLHGMSDSPYSMRRIGLALHQQGYQVVGLRLPGHGTIPSGLRYVERQDMTAAVQMAMRHLDRTVKGKPLHMVGYSTGASLSLEYALLAMEDEQLAEPASLILISPAIRIHPAAGLASFKDSLAGLPGLDNLAYASLDPEFDPYKYNSFATNAGDVVHRVTTSVTSKIRNRVSKNPDVVLPRTLVFKSTVDATVTTQAVVDHLLIQLKPDRHELVLFDINRHAAVQSRLLIDDPAPLTSRVMEDKQLPFAVSLVTNKQADSTDIVTQYKPAYAGEVTKISDMEISWPDGIISLSHVALPFSIDDPVYGRTRPDDSEQIFLGQISLKGERDLLQISPNWLIRLRYNPFYDYLEQRTLDWINTANSKAMKTSPPW